MKNNRGMRYSWLATVLYVITFVVIASGCSMPQTPTAPERATEIPPELEAKLEACLARIPEDASPDERKIEEERCRVSVGAQPSGPRGGSGSGGAALEQ